MTPLERADAAIRRFGPWHHFPVREWKQLCVAEAIQAAQDDMLEELAKMLEFSDHFFTGSQIAGLLRAHKWGGPTSDSDGQ
jgi:hypothetical protein